MDMILAVELDARSSEIERVWWRPVAQDNTWTAPGTDLDASEVAHAVAAGHTVVARVNRDGQWLAGPAFISEDDRFGRRRVRLDGGQESVDEALAWLTRNWRLRAL
jgi:hypothetical protein